MSKKKFLVLLYASIFAGLSAVVSFLAFVFYVQTHEETYTSNPIFWSLVGFFAFSIIYYFGCLVWAIKTKTGKKYWNMYVERTKQKVASQSIDEIKGTDYYESLPEYLGTNKFRIKTLRSYLIPIILLMCSAGFLLLSYFEDGFNSIEPSLIILAILTSIILCMLLIKERKFIIIDEYGVHLEHGSGKNIRTFHWDKIKTIELSVGAEGKRISWGYIYFTTRKFNTSRAIPEYFEKPYIVMLKYRPSAVHCTLKYWDKEIKNLDAMKSWKRYIDKL